MTRALHAVRLAYRKGWDAQTLQRRLYEAVRVCKTAEASARLVAMDEITRL